MIKTVPDLCGGCAIALTAILEPVTNLGRRQVRLLGQLALLRRVWVWVDQIGIAQDVARALLEAVRLLLAIPNSAGQWVLLADAVLVDGSQ